MVWQEMTSFSTWLLSRLTCCLRCQFPLKLFVEVNVLLRFSMGWSTFEVVKAMHLCNDKETKTSQYIAVNINLLIHAVAWVDD